MPSGRWDADAEARRLEIQGARFAATTAHAFAAAGVRPGMRVLDVGCGTGESTRVLAELVGATGTVAGVDRDAALLAVARARGHGELVEAEVHALPPTTPPFDAACGRFVLAFQDDVVATVRSVAAHVRPGGVLAFVEIDRSPTFPSVPQLPLWERIGALVGEGLTRSGVGRHTGMELGSALLAAGLVDVRVQVVDAFLQQPGDRYDSWHLAALLRMVLPTLEEAGIVTAESLDVDTVEERLFAEVQSVRGVGRGPLVFAAWGTRV